MSTPRNTAPSHDTELSHARWRKSSYSGGANDCIEIAELPGRIAIRDSKDTQRQPLLFSRTALHALVHGIGHWPIG
ncbi:DUF397 domain-containing protein [Streptomyces justiciae]|uniref:DUF397 domain-containing protein n=1 Tax=Streptomyces justiciae TaxID=2780140 RepID=UPI0018823EC5|nr:DUF397 domain-containing protein [Streptomyces justiciae]MBE8477502.1 DUF397 domain-containing protein [Streptomyces justiciae]